MGFVEDVVQQHKKGNMRLTGNMVIALETIDQLEAENKKLKEAFKQHGVLSRMAAHKIRAILGTLCTELTELENETQEGE